MLLCYFTVLQLPPNSIIARNCNENRHDKFDVLTNILIYRFTVEYPTSKGGNSHKF